MDKDVSNHSTPVENVPDSISNIVIRRDYNKSRSLTSNESDARSDVKRMKRSHALPNTGGATSTSAMVIPPASQSTQPSFVSPNIFDALSSVDPESDVNNASQVPPTTVKNNRRPPPITIINKGTKQTRELMNSANIPQTAYHMKAVKSGTQLNATDNGTFEAAIVGLQNSNTEFFTFTPSHQQPVRFILSGLTLYDLAELKQELEFNEVRPTELKIFSRKMCGPEESVLYLVYFAKGTIKLSELRKIKTLFSTMVNWRFFSRRPEDAVQCHRCQQFGHGTRYCNVSPLCVKCGDKHLTADCRLPARTTPSSASSNRSEIRCANCSGNHTANFRGCPTRKSYIKQLQEKRQRASQKTSSVPRPPPYAPSASPRNVPTVQGQRASAIGGLSFAQVVEGSASAEASKQSSNLFTITEFMCLAKDLFLRLQACRSKEQQFLALSELIIKYVYNG